MLGPRGGSAVDEVFDHWLVSHPHICAWMFLILIFPVIHLYLQTWTIRRVKRMRRGDGWWPQPARKQPLKSRPPADPSSEPTPRN